MDKKPKTWVLMVATAAGLGYAPIASGTAGTAGAFLLALLLVKFSVAVYLLIWLALFGLACWTAQAVQDALGKDDPSIVVIDEVAGYLLAVFLLPPSLGYLIAAFFIFRLFDIVKPFPASYFDREVKNGFGIVMDDVVAGIYTNLALQLFRLGWG